MWRRPSAAFAGTLVLAIDVSVDQGAVTCACAGNANAATPAPRRRRIWTAPSADLPAKAVRRPVHANLEQGRYFDAVQSD